MRSGRRQVSGAQSASCPAASTRASRRTFVPSWCSSHPPLVHLYEDMPGHVLLHGNSRSTSSQRAPLLNPGVLQEHGGIDWMAGCLLQYVPFIQGPRNCLGQYFALLEARVVLALLVKVRLHKQDLARRAVLLLFTRMPAT